MVLKIHNTLSGTKEIFEPVDNNHVRVYACGPTVYNYAHIGNARMAVVNDLLVNVLRTQFEKVTYVSNITDIDDKIIDAAKKQNISINDLTKQVIQGFHEDIGKLNVLAPTYEPKATDNIDAIISLIDSLLENEYAYVSDGHVLFDVKKYNEYGQLSGKKIDDLISGSRVEIAEYKNSPLDFVLWKPSNEEDDESVRFNSPWSIGRPGWHIECSAMSTKYLGADFDIHGGGADLKFPHHENEIAQSCCANKGSKYAKYWIHNGFLTVDNEKMSKSLGNFTIVKDLLDSGVKGNDLRFFFLTVHYKKPLDFNKKSLDDAIKQNNKFNQIIKNSIVDLDLKNIDEVLPDEFVNHLADDLNTAKAISLLNQKYKLAKKGDQDAIVDLYKMCKFLAILDDDEDNQLSAVPESIIAKAKMIKSYRKARNYGQADEVRDELLGLGYKLEYLPDGNVKVTK